MQPLILTQLHGYRSGHQLLQSNVALDRRDQDLVDRLSDIAGPLRPGELFSPYLTAYPLPSQKFYVIALTEQDLGAPRAGCVSTHTSFIGMDDWALHPDPALLVHALSSRLTITLVEPSFETSGLAPVRSQVLYELVEALFLEKRTSIVLFDPPSPNTIALRLLSVFWPGLRRTFSLCTFALSPRTLSNKNFDLVFAPKSSRSRFSAWDGRRIEGGGKTASLRHKWTLPLVEKIFFAQQPTLFDRATMESLAIDNDDLESAFRITFLWEELLQKSKSSPTAVLGLIDIANSRNAIAGTWPILEGAILDSLEITESQCQPATAWEFIDALLGKLPSAQTTTALGLALGSTALSLARTDWKAAITYLSTASAGQRLDLDLQRLIAVSVVESSSTELAEEFCKIPAHRLLEILSLDNQILPTIRLLSASGVDICVDDRIVEGVNTIVPSLRKSYWFTFLKQVRGDEDLAIVAALIEGAAPTDLEVALNLVWANSESRSPALGQIFCDAAIKGNVCAPMRATFSELGLDDTTVGCIEELIEFDLQTINWLMHNEEIVFYRTRLLRRFVERASLQQLNALLTDAATADQVLRSFAAELEEFSDSISKILQLPAVSSSYFFEIALKLLPIVGGEARRAVAHAAALRVFSSLACEEPDLASRVLTMVRGQVDIQILISEILNAVVSSEQVSKAVVAIEDAPAEWRGDFVLFTELIARHLLSRRKFDLSASAAVSFARLLESHFAMYPYKSAALSSHVFAWIVTARDCAASEILKVVFPNVYRNIRDEPFSMVNVFMFATVDRRKEARRDLVRAFLVSSWPPLDLAIIAYQIQELNRVFMRLVKEPNGKSLLHKITEVAYRLNEPARAMVTKAAAIALKSGSYVSESDT